MKLTDLFEDPMSDDEYVVEIIKDILTPVYATGIDKVSIKQLLRALNNQDLGVPVDADFVFGLLNPQHIQFVDRVDGNNIYFKQKKSPEDYAAQNSDDEHERQVDTIKSMASDHAKKQAEK